MLRKPPRPATSIRDVARMAGVSPSTVSRILNGRSSGLAISTATIERVRAAAGALRYRPNASARSLRTAATQSIGVIVQNLLHPFFADFLRVVYGVCQTRGYHVLVGHAEQGEHEGVMLGDLLSHDRVDGLLLIGDVLQHVGDEAQMQTVLQMHRHVVSVGCRASPAVELSIAVDNAAGVTMALEYLVELGHRSIAYIAGPVGSDERDSWESEQRRAAYRRFMTSRGLPRAPEQEVVVTDDLAAAQDALQRLVASPARPTAAFAVNDWTALVTLKAALTCGIRVPGDLSLIGFDDIAVSALYTPGLTTIHQPLDAMGHYAANTLLDSIEGRPPARPHIEAAAEGLPHTLFTPTLVRRESCGPPSRYVG